MKIHLTIDEHVVATREWDGATSDSLLDALEELAALKMKWVDSLYFPDTAKWGVMGLPKSPIRT